MKRSLLPHQWLSPVKKLLVYVFNATEKAPHLVKEVVDLGVIIGEATTMAFYWPTTSRLTYYLAIRYRDYREICAHNVSETSQDNCDR